MSRQTRSLSELPEYYFKLSTKQQSNWRRNTKKIQRNEELRSKYAPYHPSSNIIVIHLHHQTEIETVERLIKQAEETEQYALDTESEHKERRNEGALIQIQMIHAINYSTIILIEVKYLPDPTTLLYQRIKQLWSTIFGKNHQIISWGSYEQEMEDFNHMDLVQSGNLFRKYNLQFKFQQWYDGEAHPARESRDNEAGIELYLEASDDDDIFSDDIQGGYNETKTVWSLQQAVATTLGKFLDKSETLSFWQCGIDLELKTWQQKLFSHGSYDRQIEEEARLKLKQYAIYDCTTLAELYYHINPVKTNIYQEPTPISISTSISTPTATTTSIKSINDLTGELSDISEDDLMEILKPKFNFASQRQQQQQEQIPKPPPLTKSQRQKIKNEKFKAKKKYHPDFQNKMKRPIYYKYDYQKIRAQLKDDNIHHTHQITINEEKQEVMIPFRSKQEREQATLTIKINYFSKQQYLERWG
ncbi:unnamed protein product [Adineta steineri]|uniref:Uncharacterized protein n=1 Tax=Adineta steineri TaxID=433720 RepID=A0A815PV69_9BILA|nr:unnamed protein product [Adineta steineri]CAF4082689.1 unnamed protein product [Adineta steineri]